MINTEEDLLKQLHLMIDKKFNRINRDKYVNPFILKAKLTLFSISKEFIDYDPKFIVKLLKILVKRGSVITNIDEPNINPFDAYFIPSTELADESEYIAYSKGKNKFIN